MTESDRAGEPLISVIVPIFNLQDHIGPCIQSLRAQTHTTIQVLLIDDGSTDASASRAREAMGDDPRLTLISQKNEGLSAARNVGLAAAQGEFIAFVDGDDRVAQDYLSALLASLEAHPDMPWAACAIRNCHGDGSITPHSAIFDAPEASMAPGTQRFAFREASDVIRHYPSAWNKLYRRAFIGDLRFTVGSWFEDHAFYLALALTAPGIVHLAAPLYEQTRGRPGQITETDSDRIFEQ
ncbi:MAG: glycosyltransferase family A protein, partial [Pseudomonadota bacterium]